eukprot:2864899-Pleurochrysis_carterae.AAC.3
MRLAAIPRQHPYVFYRRCALDCYMQLQNFKRIQSELMIAASKGRSRFISSHAYFDKIIQSVVESGSSRNGSFPHFYLYLVNLGLLIIHGCVRGRYGKPTAKLRARRVSSCFVTESTAQELAIDLQNRTWANSSEESGQKYPCIASCLSIFGLVCDQLLSRTLKPNSNHPKCAMRRVQYRKFAHGYPSSEASTMHSHSKSCLTYIMRGSVAGLATAR